MQVTRFRLSDFGPTKFSTYARDINSMGVVLAGMRPKEGVDSAFLFDGKSISNLPISQGETLDLRAVSDTGEVVGSISAGGPSTACAWLDGKMEVLEDFDDCWSSCAHDINDHGTVVGYHPGRAGFQTHVFWTRGQTSAWRYTEFFPDFVPFEHGGGMAMVINNRHMIAGVVAGHAFLKKEDQYTKIAAPNALGLWPYGINNNGIVVGSAIESDEEYAFRYTSKVESLGTIAGSKSQALAINDHGVIVGLSSYQRGRDDLHGFIWNNGKMFDLNDLILNRGQYVIESGDAINNSGQIAATAKLDGVDRAVLLTPDT